MTTQSPILTELHCTQCGGELHPDEGQVFLACPYCGATVYLDKSRVVFHWYIAPTLNLQQATGELYRWMSGSQTVKDLDKKARVVAQSFQYFPLWYFKYRGPTIEEVMLEPAAATSITELKSLKLPAGDFKKYESSLDSQAQPPSVPLEAALSWVKQGSQAGVNPAPQADGQTPFTEMALVHVPVFIFKYVFGGQTYTALVDAASGVVFANLYPHKREAPYLLVGAVTALVFLCLALAPVIGSASGGAAGFGTGVLVYLGVGLVAAPILFAWAFWVASKI